MKHAAANPSARFATVIALLGAVSARAQPAASLTTGDDPISMPGIARVLVAFLLIAGLAVGAALALRRFAPRLASGSLFEGAVAYVSSNV